LERTSAVADAEAHLRGLPTHPEPPQQALEVRVVAIVENDEPGVDVMGLVGRVDANRMRVTPDIRSGLEQRDLVALVQQVRNRETRDAGADDGDLHGFQYVAGAGSGSR